MAYCRARIDQDEAAGARTGVDIPLERNAAKLRALYAREIDQTTSLMARTARLMGALALQYDRFEEYCELADTYERLEAHLEVAQRALEAITLPEVSA